MKYLILFFSLSLHASLTKYDVTDSTKINFNYSEICTHYNKTASLIESKNSTTLNCMGEDVSIVEFCEEKFKNDSDYTRAYLDKNNNQVICQKAKRVVLKYKCSRNSVSSFCIDAITGCQQIKKILAHNLDTIHKSLIKRDDGSRDLNCYFENDIALNDL